MRILVVVQRYGVEVNGGAEQHARWLAEALASRGNDVHVLTTCARDYTSWANFYPEGDSVLNSVVVHRLPADVERDMDEFNHFSQQIDFVSSSHSVETEVEWLRLQGPVSSQLDEWLVDCGESFDVVVPFTYLYRPSHHVIHRLSGRVPIVMHATAHDEPPFHLRLIQGLLRRVDGFLCSTPEEAALLERSVGGGAPRCVVGVGVPERSRCDEAAELRSLGLEGVEFALVLGRVDGSKGVVEAVEHFRAFRRTNGAGLRLVVAGQNVAGLPSDDDVVFLGFVSDDQVTALLNGARCLIQPSRYESFSLVLCEAWIACTPTLVTAASDVLVGQTHRSRGGLCYSSESEFVSGLQALLSNRNATDRMGRAGHRYVRSLFDPGVVADRIEQFLQSMV